MGLSTTYTKTETDFLIRQLEKKTASGYKGDLRKSDPAPTQIGFYGLLETGVYTNLGGIDAQAGKFNFASFDGTTWSLLSTSFPAGQNSFSETDEINIATMKPTADFVKEKIAEKIEDEINRDNLHEFVDKQKKRFAYFDANGKLHAYFSDELLELLRELKQDESTDAFRLVDKANRIVTWIDENGFLNAKIKDINPDKTTGLSMLSRYPYDSEKGDLELLSMTMISDVCTITTVAKGRNSTASSNDAPTFALSNLGSTAHPSVIYFPQKWNGKKYWMAFTPYFGTINTLSDYVQYENPHVMCSDDGINWTEPVDHFGNVIQNPLAQPVNAEWAAANSSFGYYSDTHIEMGDDGYMYLYYRGNYMPYPTLTDTNKVVFILMRRSRDGVNWSEPVLIKSTTDADVDNRSGMVSPAIVNVNGTWNYYDVAYSTTTHPYAADNAQEGKFTFRMSGNSPDNFELRDAGKIVRFDSRPWGTAWEPWHIDVKKFGNLYLMVINAGLKNLSNGEGLFLAYSGDGWNWKCLPDALFSNVTYRSSIILKDFNNDILTFWLYRGRKDNGKIEVHEIKLKYNN